MKFDILAFLTNPFVPLFFVAFTGILFGKIKFGKFNFGISGTLFTGIFAGWFLYSKYAVPFIGPDKKPIANAPKYAINYITNGVISEQFFTLTLILFIAAVGLLAAKDLKMVLQKYGVKFLGLGAIITGTCAFIIYLSTLIFKGQNPFAVSGVYTGALTSSPGLAAALEATAKYGKEAQALVGMGHTIGYPVGVLMCILVMNFFPVIFKMDVQKEKEKYMSDMGKTSEIKVEDKPMTAKEVSIDLAAFGFVCFVGYFIGSVNIYLPFVKWISLASTGGVLVAALVLGYIGKISILNFRMNAKILSAIRDVSLMLFLSIVGLEYGYASINALSGSGAVLAGIAFVSGLIAMLVGFLVGRYVLKLNWIILAGALCGGATSTPGLGAAIDATKTDEVAAGYGAVYPFALIFKILFVIILHTIVKG